MSVDLSAVVPRAPLAVNDKLMASSDFHATEMAVHNYFGHQSQVTGEWPNKMVRDQESLYETLYEDVPLKEYYEPLWNRPGEPR